MGAWPADSLPQVGGMGRRGDTSAQREWLSHGEAHSRRVRHLWTVLMGGAVRMVQGAQSVAVPRPSLSRVLRWVDDTIPP